MYAVDYYVEHENLESIMNERSDNGWILVKLCDVTPRNDCSFQTLIWERVVEPTPKLRKEV